MEGTQAEAAETLIREGAPTEVMCTDDNGSYRQSPQRLAELQEEVEEVGEALWEIRSVLADIEEVSRSDQCQRLE